MKFPVTPTALVVEPVSADLLFTISTLSLGGFHVTVAEDFREARALLDLRRPDVLVTEVRLREYNGLHLVLRGRAADPALGAILTSHRTDPVLRAEAEALGATYVEKPISRQDFLAAVRRTIYGRRTFDARSIRPPFERRSVDRGHEASIAHARRIDGARVASTRPDGQGSESREPVDQLQQIAGT